MIPKAIYYSRPFKKQFLGLPAEIREAFYRKLELYLENPAHPSLRVKKIQSTNLWEMSITMSYRLTFQHLEDGILLRKIGTHDILNNP